MTQSKPEPDATQVNMRIWSSVEKTDPAHTKKVNQRGGFTAISASYQVMNATKQFGPIGGGWGYDVVRTEMIGDFYIAHVLVWWGSRSNYFGPVPGCAQMFNTGKDKRPDGDAPKKATTDAITKALSQLGFNADVFLGLFDDNKYVEQREKEEAGTNIDPADVKAAIANIAKCTTVDELKVEFGNIKEFSAVLAEHADVRAAANNRRAEINNSDTVGADVAKTISELEVITSLDELKNYWSTLNANFPQVAGKLSVIAAKDKCKTKIQAIEATENNSSTDLDDEIPY
jgi:hypothetical protein